MTVTAVVPWINHRELEKDFWAAMRLAPDLRVLVIDNGSEPPLPNGWRIETNSGYTHACNVGLALATTDAVLFLNNDIAPLSRDWFQPLADSFEPGVLVGAQLRHDTHAEVDGIALPYLDGWCIGGMIADLRYLGGFDETLAEPAYYSDNLLCLEARAAGMRLRECKVGLRHKANATAGPGFTTAVRDATLANHARYADRARELLGVAA